MRAFIQSSQTHIQHEGTIMVQKIVIVKDSTEQNPIPLNMDSSGKIGTTSTNAVLTAVEDQTAHYLFTKDPLSPSAAIVSGTKTCPATASTAEVIVASQACSEVTIQAPETNTVTVLFGHSTTTCYMRLAPGRDFTIPVANANLIFCKASTASATEVINFIARS